MKLVRLSCPNCGAPLNLSTSSSVMLCPFCDTRTILSDSENRVEVAPTLAWPFTVSRRRFELALLEFLADGDLTPDDVLEEALVTERVGVYLPFYECRGEFRATFTASSGYDRQEKTHYVERDASGREKRRTRSQTFTDWRPMNGEASGDFRVVVGASANLPEVLRQWSREVVATETDEPPVLEDVGEFVLEAAAFQADEAMLMGGREQLTPVVEAACRERVPGDRCKDLHAEYPTPQVRVKAAWHPFWLATFQYGGRSWPVGFSGRSADKRYGERPVDAEREARLKALNRPFLIALGVSVAVAFLGLCLGGIPTALAVLVGGPITAFLGWRAHKARQEIIARSKAVRAEVLARAKAAYTSEQEEPS